jgi:hypothetical protein
MGYGNIRTGVIDGTLPTPLKIPGALNDGPTRAFVEIFDLSKTNVDKVAGTNNICFDIPDGHAPMAIIVRSTVSLTTSQLAFGITGTVAKFGTAKAYGTTPELAVEYLLTSMKGVQVVGNQRVIMTCTVADLPGAGIICVEMRTSARG